MRYGNGREGRWALYFAAERSNLGCGRDPITASQRPSAIVQKAKEPYHQGSGLGCRRRLVRRFAGGLSVRGTLLTTELGSKPAVERVDGDCPVV